MTYRFAAGALLALVALLRSAQPAQAQADGWRSKRSLPTPRRLLAAATEGGLVYTFGGCGSPCFQPPFHTSTLEETRVEVFDPAADAWTERRPIPAIFFGGAAAAPGDGRIYLAGGTFTGNLLLAYQPAADAWSTRAPMPTARYGLAVAALGGKLYAVGGSGPSAALEIYDPATDTWTAAAPMPTARVFLAAAALGGKLYAVGGSPDCCGGARTAAVEAYDPATGRWQARAPLPVALQVSAAAALDGKLYVFGGNIPGADSQRFTFEYDPAADAWAARTAMPTPRDQAPAAVVGGVDGKAYVLGGSIHCHCSALGDNEEYTPEQPAPLPAADRRPGDPPRRRPRRGDCVHRARDHLHPHRSQPRPRSGGRGGGPRRPPTRSPRREVVPVGARGELPTEPARTVGRSGGSGRRAPRRLHGPRNSLARGRRHAPERRHRDSASRRCSIPICATTGRPIVTRSAPRRRISRSPRPTPWTRSSPARRPPTRSPSRIAGLARSRGPRYTMTRRRSSRA